MIGIAISTHNRKEMAEHTISQIKKYAPKNSRIVIVDDASVIPYPNTTYRFENNVGIATAKNKCLELLQDCDYIFLFDDDCYPIVNDWHLPYINSGINHLSFTFDKLKNGRQNGNKVILDNGSIMVYNNPCGCIIFLTKKCIETVGGFNPSYKKYGYEHVDLSVRIFNSGLTENKFMDVKNSLDLFYSHDYNQTIVSSVTEHRGLHLRNNLQVYNKNIDSKEYVPLTKPNHGNIILTSYFNYVNDPQRKIKWSANISELQPLINSCNKLKQKLFIFNDCFDEKNSKYITFVKTEPSQTHSPNVYRFIVYNNWLLKNDYDNLWMVDSTDVELLKNPFDTIESDKLYCGDEIDMITDNSWMRNTQERFFKIADYRSIIAKHTKERLINCGIVGGSKKVIDKLITMWSDIHETKTFGIQYSTDMAIFNYLARKHFNDNLVHGEKINTKFKHFETNNKTAIWKHK